MSLFQQYYIDTIKKRYADFDGRARRSEYWYFQLFNILIYVGLLIISGILGYIEPLLSFIGIGLFYLLAIGLLVPSIALAVRRLHDTGKSGWMYLIALIPLAGPIILLVFMCTDSDPGSNVYGPNPKRIGGDDLTDHLIERI